MKAEFDVNMTVKDMYNFNLYHNYHNISGVAGVLFGIIAIGIAVFSYGQVTISYTLLMIIFGAMFTVITPARMYLKSAQQVKLNAMFKKPIHYVLTQEYIEIAQDDAKAQMEWENVYRVKDTGKSIIIYMSSVRAYIFPKRELKEQETTVMDIIRSKVDAKKIKIKTKQ